MTTSTIQICLCPGWSETLKLNKINWRNIMDKMLIMLNRIKKDKNLVDSQKKILLKEIISKELKSKLKQLGVNNAK
jgi:hypothetical protein|tara:strand:+ start:92 stop:319 length:228 start_codon:yes stop_codon:yes gene_type:complete